MERTSQLEFANRELEAFAYTVSHDLRAPLRAIDGFSAILMEDCVDSLNTEGKKYLHNIRTGCWNMNCLIDGLLTLSRMTRGELNRESIDLSAMAAEIVNTYRCAEPDRRVRCDIMLKMAAVGDPRLVKTLLENLLGNAWKYSKVREEAHIAFGVDMQEGMKVFFVRDNGVGFDMAYADKMFQPFQSLHKADEFEGMGIGLATVQRIVHRHGGRIWAEAAVGKGATFFFTLATEEWHCFDVFMA